MVLSFPRYGSELGIEHLIWITPLPLLFAATGVGARQGFFLGWIAGLTLEAAGFSWILLAIRTFSSLPPIFASLLFAVWLWMSALPWGLLGCVLGKIRRPAAVLWVIPFWVALEHYFPRLFPWHVGGALWNTSLAHCVDLLGASGLTALVFLVSAALYLSIESWRGRRLLPWGTLLATIALVIAAFVYAGLRRSSLEERLAASDARLRVGFVQGAIDPRTSTSGIDEVRWYLDATEDLIR
ncbi:MAG TPA: hypothetical protein VK116_05910, partial [Planctomycetota bacterium]|nr:hypothetical protein [Planctomycetota bacterium]